MAAAAQMLTGKTLYRDIWFDKPPLLPAAYLLWRVEPGWPLRLAGALYASAGVRARVSLRRRSVGPAEGLWAAALLAFFLTFDTAFAVTPLAADLLMLAPHLAAVCLAWRGRPFWSGLAVGVAFADQLQGAVRAGGVRACGVIARFPLWWPASPSRTWRSAPGSGRRRPWILLRTSMEVGSHLRGPNFRRRSGPQRAGADGRLAGISCRARDSRRSGSGEPTAARIAGSGLPGWAYPSSRWRQAGAFSRATFFRSCRSWCCSARAESPCCHAPSACAF